MYAQRPDATAVLEIERWNRSFGRWVNQGATGIAVFDDSAPGRSRLKYYFDISDTHATRFARPVPIWTVREEYAPDISHGERLSVAEPIVPAEAGGTPWEIRVASPEVPKATPSRDLHEPADIGRLNAQLAEIEQTAQARMEQLTVQIAKEAGVTEELKAMDQIKWVDLTNNIRHSAEETVLNDLIYS